MNRWLLLLLIAEVVVVRWVHTSRSSDARMLKDMAQKAMKNLHAQQKRAVPHHPKGNSLKGHKGGCPRASMMHMVSRASTAKSRRKARAARLFEETTRLLIPRIPGGLNGLQSLQTLVPGDALLGVAQRECTVDVGAGCDPSSPYRRSNGACNNLANPRWGMAGICMSRLLTPAYQDGVSAPRVAKSGQELPNARLLSQLVHPDRRLPSPHFSHMLMQLGQFIDHDLALAPLEGADETDEINNLGNPNNPVDCCTPDRWVLPHCYSIAVPEGDTFFAPLGQTCLNMPRSAPCSCQLGPREQTDSLTSYLDGSQIYGSSEEDTARLRLFQFGLLKTQSLEGEELLPQSFRPESDRCSSLETGEICFRAGDERVNEHPALTSMHTVWLRQHNRIARRLSQLNSLWDDERLFQEARRIVNAQYQHIVYSEWLPPILGPDAMIRYSLVPTGRSRYAPDVDATISNEFAAAAFRLGHTLIDGVFERIDVDSQRSPYELQDFYFFPFYLYHGDMDNIIRGLLRRPGQHYDSFITVGVTQHLYRLRNDSYGLDLIALNLQRGRDHGLRPYVDYLQFCTGYTATTFEDLLRYTPAHVVQLYSTLYDDVTDIDLFTGGITETSVQGGLVGPTFACILGNTFRNLKFGDRFYYEHEGQAGSFAPEQVQEIRKTSLAQILCENCYSLSTVQAKTMFRPDLADNPEVACGTLPRPDLSVWQYVV
ncbi:salivary peroxidase/catechol oxidase-like [Haemaphysalis longicornis]